MPELWTPDKIGKLKKKRYVTYIRAYFPNHPRADEHGYVYEHILVAEAALGRYLPEGAEVHHVNGNKQDNRPENLVICEDSAYHSLLHQRTRARLECGNANWRKCKICKEYDDPRRMMKTPKGECYHSICWKRYMWIYNRKEKFKSYAI